MQRWGLWTAAVGLALVLGVGCGKRSATETEAPPREQSPMRQANMDRLVADGFRPATWLPEGRTAQKMRPIREVAGRLMALRALFLRTVLPETSLPEALVQAHVERNKLLTYLTPEEQAILQVPREEVATRHGDSIGWRLENIWALAWVLGHDHELTYLGGMVGPPEIEPIFDHFIPGFADGALDEWVGSLKPRPLDTLIRTEDLFYCAHNAVRSAQLGHEGTVPDGFHPVGDGGTVHERRHVLTWVLSPGVPWGDTDLST